MAVEGKNNQDSDIDLGISLSGSQDTGDSPEISLDEQVREQIEKFAATDTSKELGGVLIGEMISNASGTQVRIHAAIEAKYTEAVHTSVKFTHASWDDINKTREEKYPDMRIVGWFHTHPGFGIFLSRWDMFIQENFFNLPWQVAFVVDPIDKTSGFFRWENGKVVQVGKDRVKIPLPVTIEFPEQPARNVRSTSNWSKVAASITIIGLCGALIYSYFFRPPEVIVKKVIRTRIVEASKRETEKISTYKTYTVQEGDSLWSIAQNEYGDGVYMNAIAAFNREIDIDKTLYAGIRIDLPCREVANKLCGIRQPGRN